MELSEAIEILKSVGGNEYVGALNTVLAELDKPNELIERINKLCPYMLSNNVELVRREDVIKIINEVKGVQL